MVFCVGTVSGGNSGNEAMRAGGRDHSGRVAGRCAGAVVPIRVEGGCGHYGGGGGKTGGPSGEGRRDIAPHSRGLSREVSGAIAAVGGSWAYRRERMACSGMLVAWIEVAGTWQGLCRVCPDEAALTGGGHCGFDAWAAVGICAPGRYGAPVARGCRKRDGGVFAVSLPEITGRGRRGVKVSFRCLLGGIYDTVNMAKAHLVWSGSAGAPLQTHASLAEQHCSGPENRGRKRYEGANPSAGASRPAARSEKIRVLTAGKDRHSLGD